MDNSTVVPCPPPSLTYLEESSQFLKFFNDLNQFAVEVVTVERNKNKESLAALEDEVDTCKQVIDFLVSQRDETKKAIGKTDEQLLDYRNGFSQNRDILVRVQNPMFGGPKDRTSSPTK